MTAAWYLGLMSRLLSAIVARYVVDEGSGCWLWIGTKSRKGYGYIKTGGRSRSAHRMAYELMVGQVPAGLELDHLCCNRACVNPGHLEPVTHLENVRRALVRRTSCLRGHPFDAENTYSYRGRRICRECSRSRSREHKRKFTNHQPRGNTG